MNDFTFQSKMAFKIDAKSVYDRGLELMKLKNEIYQSNFKICLKRILDASYMNQTRCEFTVPFVVFDKPPYKAKECIDYIYKKLYKRGFGVEKHAEPNKIIIRWHMPTFKMKKHQSRFAEEQKEKAQQKKPVFEYEDDNPDEPEAEQKEDPKKNTENSKLSMLLGL